MPPPIKPWFAKVAVWCTVKTYLKRPTYASKWDGLAIANIRYLKPCRLSNYVKVQRADLTCHVTSESLWWFEFSRHLRSECALKKQNIQILLEPNATRDKLWLNCGCQLSFLGRLWLTPGLSLGPRFSTFSWHRVMPHSHTVIIVEI